MATIDWPRARRRHRTGPPTWLAAPALAFFGMFALVPLAGVVVLSFMSWNQIGTPTWIGLENWDSLFVDNWASTSNAIRLSLIVMIASWAVQTPLSLILGVYIAGKRRYRSVLAVLFFLPLLFSYAAIGIGWKQMLDPNFGLARGLEDEPFTALSRLLTQNWLGSEQLALPTTMFIIAWVFVPFHSLLYQAGVRQIPANLYEAAMVDGANLWQRFWSITIPQLRYTIVTSSTLMLVGSLTFFDLIWVMTYGGPGEATTILPLDMYRTGFLSQQMGKASAIATILVVVGLTLAIVLNRLSGSTRMESQQEGM